MASHYTDCLGRDQCHCETRRYRDIFIWGLVALLVEIVGGIASGSFALLADVGHVLADNVAVILSIFVARKALGAADSAAEHAIRARGGRVSALLLGAVTLGVLAGAIERFIHPNEIAGISMLGFTILGGVINYLQHLKLHRVDESDKHITHKALHKHIWSDLMQSVGVAVGAIAIALTGWHVIDPLISVWISARMAKWSWEIWRESAVIADPASDLKFIGGWRCHCDSPDPKHRDKSH